MKSNLFIVISFLIIIFSVLFWYPVEHILITKGINELQMTDNWKFYNKKREGLFGQIGDFIEEKKVMLENRTTNYFPFYHELNSYFYDINYKLDDLFYSEDIPMGLNSDNAYIFFNKDNEFYYLRTMLNKKELDNRVKSQINFFNELSEENKDVNLNIYIPTSYQLTTLTDNNINGYIKAFISGLNDNIKVSSMKINNMDEYKKYFYATDHHWNMYGALEGYRDIMLMLDKDYIKNINVLTVDDIKFYGSITKSILSKRIYDKFYDVDLKLDYQVLINGEENDSFKPRKITYGGNDNFFDYYVHYFNGQYGLVEYTYNNEEKDNLLIFSDSYVWEIDYLLASNYNKTYVVNLRYDDYKDNVFNYNEFIKKNKITDVLFLYEGESILFDQYDYGFDKKVSKR